MPRRQDFIDAADSAFQSRLSQAWKLCLQGIQAVMKAQSLLELEPENLLIQLGHFCYSLERPGAPVLLPAPINAQVGNNHVQPAVETRRSFRLKGEQAAKTVFAEFLADMHETVIELHIGEFILPDHVPDGGTIALEKRPPGLTGIRGTQLRKQIIDRKSGL